VYPLYADLRRALGTPKWIDQHGVPRYHGFSPELLGIYDDWAVLITVTCQACGQEFQCGIGACSWQLRMENPDALQFEDRHDPMKVLPLFMGWGDAPWHTHEGEEDRFDGQCAGTTMSYGGIQLLQVWVKDGDWRQLELTKEQMSALPCDFDD